jgi:hypothetical protein
LLLDFARIRRVSRNSLTRAAHNAHWGSRMATTTDYRKRADECALHAATAANDQARAVWSEMERYWRKRAQAVEAPLVPDQSPKRER